MTFDVRASATGLDLPHSLPWRVFLLSIASLGAVIVVSGGSPRPSGTVALLGQQEDPRDQNYYANAHPYLEEPLEQLIKRIPELQTIQPGPHQQALPTILENTGEKVDEFFWSVVDLEAHETIREEKLGGQGQVRSWLQVEDGYLLVRRGGEMLGRVNEYRMDSNGNRLEETGLNNGYFVTSGFALNHVYFSTAFQSECNFRYLGEEKVGLRDTYVVAFAQKPGEATTTVGMEGHQGRGVHFHVFMLVQGIAWVDKSNFQIIRMRTDLLAPRDEIRLDWLTTIVTFGEVQLPEVATPLWLPSDAQVDAHFTLPNDQIGYSELNFRNEHHYSDYKSYRVSVKMVPDVATEPVPSHAQLEDDSEKRYYANAHPYLEEPLEELGKHIPELKNVRPATDQGALPGILEKTAGKVDDFLRHVVDLIASEKITQEKLNGKGVVTASERVHDDYLILRHGNEIGAEMVEYRMDAEGNRMDRLGLNKGYLVTFGFALSCNYFSTGFQPESRFYYLGDQRIGQRDTCVVAFVQRPGEATLFNTLTERGGATVAVL
jgi:hypothetical protein